MSDFFSSHTIPAGKLFCFSEGEYSDYGYVGHFLALEEITWDTFTKARAAAFKADEDDEWDQESLDRFIAELIRMGVVMDVEVRQIHVGSYGRVEIGDKPEPPNHDR